MLLDVPCFPHDRVLNTFEGGEEMGGYAEENSRMAESCSGGVEKGTKTVE
jgi:hypothetical protein